MAGIAKKAKGLQRFMLDCGFWQSPSWKGLRRVAEIGLMAAAVSYCNEHLTDGELPGPIDELASALGLQERDIKKPLDNFLTKAKWLQNGDTYTIVGYLDHNPSRREVMDDRARRAASAAKANHERWHVEKGITDPTCDLCPSLNGSKPRSESDQTRESNGLPCIGTEATEATEASELKDAKDVGPSSSSSEEPLSRQRQDDDDPPSWAWRVAERQAAEPRRPGVEPIHDHASWVAAAARRAYARWGAEVATWDMGEAGIVARIFDNQRDDDDQHVRVVARLQSEAS